MIIAIGRIELLTSISSVRSHCTSKSVSAISVRFCSRSSCSAQLVVPPSLSLLRNTCTFDRIFAMSQYSSRCHAINLTADISIKRD